MKAKELNTFIIKTGIDNPKTAKFIQKLVERIETLEKKLEELEKEKG